MSIKLEGDIRTSRIILQYPTDLDATSNLKTGINNCLERADVKKIVQILKHVQEGPPASILDVA